MSIPNNITFLSVLPDNLTWIEPYLTKIREHIWVRREDQLLILRPSYVHHLNELGTFLLDSLLNSEAQSGSLLTLINQLKEKYSNLTLKQLLEDICHFFEDLRTLVDKKRQSSILSLSTVEMIPFRSRSRFYPILSEIAITYRCNNSCLFCYAHSPYIQNEKAELSTEQVKRLLDIIRYDAKVPSVSFTGGEPTLRADLPELIQYARSLQLRVNLITNGRNCGLKEYAKSLADAGLQSAQISIEAADSTIHDELVNSQGAYSQTVQGIKNLKELGVFVHTNTTINQLNKDHLEPLVKFLAEEIHNEHFSMNALILTGSCLENINRKRLELKYSDLEPTICSVMNFANQYNIRFVWYSPTCYHYLNPVKLGLGIKQCAACDGLLSINPYGEIIPCSSFQTPIGPSLLDPNVQFEAIWGNKSARYWREKQYIRAECKKCKYEYLCKGACPLYWDAQKCNEIKNAGQYSSVWDQIKWFFQRKFIAPQYGTSNQ
jgi:radical SAM protein with 4Fe4S-binding SPASM domain